MFMSAGVSILELKLYLNTLYKAQSSDCLRCQYCPLCEALIKKQMQSRTKTSIFHIILTVSMVQLNLDKTTVVLSILAA